MPFHAVEEFWDTDLVAGDPLGFPGYDVAGIEPGDAVVTGRTSAYAFIQNRFEVHGGTMGLAVGEKVVRAYDRARDLRLPVVVATCTGGARVQEGMLALPQLARTAAAAERHAAAGLLSLAVHQSPTTGGVYISYAAAADLQAVHPMATIGFAGPRVAETVTGRRLPAGSHTGASLYENGWVDALVSPGEEAEWIDVALGDKDLALPTRPLATVEVDDVGGAWGEVLRARAPGRPSGLDRAARLCRSWTEIRGADPVVRAGLATVADRRCVVVATDRYSGTGRPGPSAYRTAQRAVQLAGRLGLPVLTLVDTPGAEPSAEAEADGIARALSETFTVFAACPTPVVSVCVGEGGSGGALALSFADRLLMCEHAIFSVIGPEGAAAILERDGSRAPDVADRLKLTARDVVAVGVADAVVPEDDRGLAAAVVDALADAEVGTRVRRLDRATQPWLR
jgi:acyl-CoA carboxylase subunit beta